MRLVLLNVLILISSSFLSAAASAASGGGASGPAAPLPWFTKATELCEQFRYHELIHAGQEAASLIVANGSPDSSDDLALAANLYSEAEIRFDDTLPRAKEALRLSGNRFLFMVADALKKIMTDLQGSRLRPPMMMCVTQKYAKKILVMTKLNQPAIKAGIKALELLIQYQSSENPGACALAEALLAKIKSILILDLLSAETALEFTSLVIALTKAKLITVPIPA